MMIVLEKNNHPSFLTPLNNLKTSSTKENIENKYGLKNRTLHYKPTVKESAREKNEPRED